MRIAPLLTIAIFAASALTSCNTQDKAVWDAMDSATMDLESGTGTLPPPAPISGPVGAAASGGPGVAVPAAAPGIPTPMTTPVLPRSAAPAPEIAGLAFLTGRWVAINPNKTVNEELWTPPRGNALMGSFRQIRLDGDCAFVELSQIALEEGEILLRLRHLHGRLEVPEGRSGISLFRLVSLEKDRVEFSGATGSEEVTSVVYHRTSPTELRQSIGFAPETGQANFVTNYLLDR